MKMKFAMVALGVLSLTGLSLHLSSSAQRMARSLAASGMEKEGRSLRREETLLEMRDFLTKIERANPEMAKQLKIAIDQTPIILVDPLLSPDIPRADSSLNSSLWPPSGRRVDPEIVAKAYERIFSRYFDEGLPQIGAIIGMRNLDSISQISVSSFQDQKIYLNRRVHVKLSSKVRLSTVSAELAALVSRSKIEKKKIYRLRLFFYDLISEYEKHEEITDEAINELMKKHRVLDVF